MNWHCISCVAVLLLATPSAAREWTDATGKFKVEAEIIDVKSDTVRLKKVSGDLISLSLGKLSKPDQEHVKNLLSLATAATAVLKQHCYSCHGENGTDEGGMNYVLNGARLIEQGKVTSGQPDKSLMLKRITKGEMPPEDATSRPTAVQIEALREWIKSGAFTPAGQVDREWVTNDAVIDAVFADLSGADERSRAFYRYFTITHLHNAGLGDDELQTVRLALAKLLNSLSWDRKIIAPLPIDSAQTVFRIDVRDLRWTAALWEALASAYPYGVQQSGKPATDVYRLSGTKMPLLRADWFVAQACRPPLYHALLQLPNSMDGVQRQLKISFAQNLRQDRATRAGFNNSGVSQNPRVIERHEIADGVCWVSYDFAGSTGQRNIFNNPLNFAFDGNEVIFNLPNGLQAYMLFGSSGNRIDKAPSNIVRDLQSADATVINGVSCMRCHAAGIIPKQDEVHKYADANPKAVGDKLKTVQTIYAEQTTLDKQFSEDQERYREALTKIGITRASAEGEPITNITRRFRQPVNLTLASAEFGRTPAEMLAAVDKSVALQRLVGALRVPGGTIPRDAFEVAFGGLVAPLGIGRFHAPSMRVAEPSEVASNDAGSDGGNTETTSDLADDIPAGTDVRVSLVHQWKFDETKGDVAHDSVGRNNATLFNFEKDSPRFVKGKIGRGLQFYKPEEMAVPAKVIDFPQFTITFWLNVQMESKKNSRIVDPWIMVNYDFDVGHGVGMRYEVVEPVKPTPDEWFHYAMLIDKVKRKGVLYRNGNEVASGGFTIPPPGVMGGRWAFGHFYNPTAHGDSLNGILDDVRVYKKLLTADEVAKLAKYGVRDE